MSSILHVAVIKETSFLNKLLCKAHLTAIINTLIRMQKGFPKDASLDELEEFFADHGKVSCCSHCSTFCMLYFLNSKIQSCTIMY